MSGIISGVEFLRLLKPQLEARADFQARDPVPTVVTHWPTIEFSISDEIILGYLMRSTVEAAAVGRGRVDEAQILDAQVRCMRAGAGEETSNLAVDAALELVRMVDNELRSNHPELSDPNDDLLWSRVGSWEVATFPSPDADPPVPLRIAVVTFEIIAPARVSI